VKWLATAAVALVYGLIAALVAAAFVLALVVLWNAVVPPQST
jgi:hypothetical protein